MDDRKKELLEKLKKDRELIKKIKEQNAQKYEPLPKKSKGAKR